MRTIIPTVLLSVISVASAQTSQPSYREAAGHAILPPLYAMPTLTRRGEIVVGKDDPWITPCEASDFHDSPSYDVTMAWLKKLVDASPRQLKMISLGKSDEGRDVWMVIASKEGNFTSAALRSSGKPTFFAQAGIHPGEIDGKDAGMMLLRDMTVRGNQKALLDRANFLFVPIFNVDGHERRSAYGRSNQRGPDITGWRTNSKNLNLNRDYAKLDTPELRAMVHALDEWDPDLYYDIHVTDGADYQYDITFGHNDVHAHSPSIAKVLNAMEKEIDADLAAAGNVPGRLVFEIDGSDFGKGLQQMTAEPRYSHGYGDARHIPSVLVENHALKPYDDRVLGTYVLLESTLKHLGAGDGKSLRDAIEQDRKPRSEIPLDFKIPPETESIPLIDFKGIEYRAVPSEISGGLRIEWLGKPKLYHFPFIKTNMIAAKVSRPKAYYIPPAWSDVIARLKMHGMQMETLSESHTVDVTMYRLSDVKLMPEPFEGHVGVESCATTEENRHETFVAGSVRVPTDQPLGELAVLLLEPKSPDSFLHWGFFNEILQRTEYVDGYILEPMAKKMLADDPKLAEEFNRKLAVDKDFASSPQKRLDWFYLKTPYADERWRLYPVGRE